MRMGDRLAEKILRERPNHDIDVVIPIPDTSRTSALQLAQKLNLKYREGFTKNRYIGRFQVYHFLEDEEEEIELFNGRLDRAKADEILKTLVEPAATDAFFICGPGPFMVAAEEALRGLRIGPLWDGVRGGAPLDLPAAVELLQHLGEAARGLGPVISEIDLNPVLVGRRGEGVTILDTLVRR